MLVGIVLVAVAFVRSSSDDTATRSTTTVPVPVMSRSEGNLYSGEKRAEMHVVPKFAVSATPVACGPRMDSSM